MLQVQVCEVKIAADEYDSNLLQHRKAVISSVDGVFCEQPFGLRVAHSYAYVVTYCSSNLLQYRPQKFQKDIAPTQQLWPNVPAYNASTTQDFKSTEL
eukprot:scaffold34601_cov234-Amphora_coffeaeformis.AAC.5